MGSAHSLGGHNKPPASIGDKGAPNEPEANRGRPKKERRGGYRVGAMKFPLRSAVKDYLDRRSERVRASTLSNERTILRGIVAEIEVLHSKKKMGTRNPWKMTRGDVKALVLTLTDPDRKPPLENETAEKYLRYFEGVLRFCDNKVMEELRQDAPNLFPKRRAKPIHYLKEEELATVVKAAEGFSGWKGEILRFLTAIYPGTGLRPSELRLAHIEDLNIKNWTLKVRHPKGQGNYGEARTVFVLPPFRPAVLRFVEQRRRHLAKAERSSIYLVPNLGIKEDGPYSSNHFRALKKELSEAAGVDFRLKDFRSTFASLTVKKDPALLVDVSRQLGHGSLDITQRFYANIEASDAGDRLCKAWTEEAEPVAEISKSAKNVLIKEKEYLPGYA